MNPGTCPKITLTTQKQDFRPIQMRLLSVTLLLFANLVLFAQPKQNSPYSKYGIGDPVNQFFANQAAWGGQTAAFHDPFHLNLSNPASYAHLRATALETGLFAKYSHLTASTGTKDNWSGNLAYAAIGFTLKSPINELLDKKKSPWQVGMGLALTPNTLVGYNVQTIDTLPDLGVVIGSFQGSGGTYRLTWSGGVKRNNTAFGLNLGWIFGKSVYENTTAFVDSLPTFFTNRREDVSVNGLIWRLGAQQDFVLRTAENDKTVPLRWVTVGITGEGKHNVKSVYDKLFLRSRGLLSNGQYDDADTLESALDVRQTITLPAAFTLGVQYVNANKFRAGVQFGFEGWSSYRNEARPDDFRNTISLSGGIEYIPDFASYNNYGKRIRYRLGAYYRQDPRKAEGKELDDLGLSFGFGFPITLPRQQTSFVNTAFELGKLGADSPIDETYFRITVGFTLNDNSWFYKRRFE